MKMPADDMLVCDSCTATVMRKNMSRHRTRCRVATEDDGIPQPDEVNRRRTTSLPGAGSRSRSSSAGSRATRPCSEPVGASSWHDPMESSSVASGLDLPTAEDDYPSTHRLTEAAKALLDQHHAFTEAQLCQYVAKTYPEIPAEVCRKLVIGAEAGAQRVSHLRSGAPVATYGS
jgi:hypothetical protein